jgi:MoaA/NifB/PqqE/SkfB family radical SAM enzyme
MSEAAADNLPSRPRPHVVWSQRRFQPRPVADVHGRRHDVPLSDPDPEVLRLVDWLTPSFYLDFGRPCNSACLYCAVPPHEDAMGFLPPRELPGIVAAGQAVGCDRAILIGGEPTIYPHLDAAFAALHDAGLRERHIVMTNGLKLAEPGFVERLHWGGVRTLHVSIDTTDPATYDRISRSHGRLPHQLAGLDAALRHGGMHVYTYVATSRINAGTLPRLLDDLVARAEKLQLPKPPPVVFAVVKPIGDGLRHADELVLEPRASAALVDALLTHADRVGVPAMFRNVQACLLPERVARNVDHYLDDFSVTVATGERVGYSHGEYWCKPATCAECGHNGVCTGIYRALAERVGTAAFRPIDRQGLA